MQNSVMKLFSAWLLMVNVPSMGLFLQKTNIIRDYLEDYVDGRAFWPQDVWKKHAKTGQLGEFALPQFRYVFAAPDYALKYQT